MMSLINFLIHFYKKIQKSQETSNERGSKFIPGSVELLCYHFQKIDIRRAESYIISPDWIARKKATINPKNEKDKCFQWSIISGLNYNNIKEKELKILLKFRRVDTDFSSYQRDWEKFEQENNSIALMFYLYHIRVKKQSLHTNQVIINVKIK